jgi:anaerobic magnesium-protoporphyrin IX monomethyl ester cyclase
MKSSSVDLVLINPPSSKDQEYGLLAGGASPRPPLNLLNLAATVREAGYSVKIIDGLVVDGMGEVIKAVAAFAPRFIGITSMTAHIDMSRQIADRLHRCLPNIRIIIGGIHVSTLPEETLQQFPAFDVGVVGEGDLTIVELLRCLDSGGDIKKVQGLIVREGKDTVRTESRPLIRDLDLLPLPAWDLLPGFIQNYTPSISRKTRLPSAFIVSSRGCPFGCTFCNNSVHGRTFRSYSVDRLIQIVDHMVNVYKVKDLTIYDENLALDKKRIKSFCHRLISENYDLTWSCDARTDSVDEDILDLMSRAGCRAIWYGMESGNPDILKRYNKQITISDIEKAVRLTKKFRIKACGSFIIGGPGETPQTIKETIRFATRLDLDWFVPFFYTPFPGSSDYPTLKQYGTVDLRYESATATRPTFAPHGMTFKKIYIWYVRAVLAFYARPSFVLKMVKEIELNSLLQSGFSFLFQCFFFPFRLLLKKNK